MKLSAKTILAAAVVLLLGCAQTPDLSASTRTPARTSKSAKSAKSSKKSKTGRKGKAGSGPSTMSLVIRALQNGPSVSRVRSVATLDKELAAAKAFETKFGERLKPQPKKQPNGKFVYSGSTACLLYEIERYRDAYTDLAEYISKQPKYNSSVMDRASSAAISSAFADFLMLQHINDLLALMPAGSHAAFKEEMVNIFGLQRAFLDMETCDSQMQGGPQGAYAAMEAEMNYQEIAQTINEWMLNLWKIIKDNSGLDAYVASDEMASRLLNLYHFDAEYGAVSNDEFSEAKSALEAAADKFISGYDKWLESYPGYPADLKNQPSRLLSSFKELAEN